jgi:hypothetical protein
LTVEGKRETRQTEVTDGQTVRESRSMTDRRKQKSGGERERERERVETSEGKVKGHFVDGFFVQLFGVRIY